MSRFLVIGAGISGCTAGLELARLGNEVEILEAESIIGGKVLSYCCKATKDCSKCGVCVAHTQIRDSIQHKQIHFTNGAALKSVDMDGGKIAARIARSNPSLNYKKCVSCDACLKACPNRAISKYSRAELVQYRIDYSSCLIHQGKACQACEEACPSGAIFCGSGERESEVTLTADGVLIASGHDPYDAAKKIRFGYGRVRNVMTGLEVEEMLSSRTSLGDSLDNIAFIQCVGSRDPQEGRNYCSGVCCAYAVRLARVLKSRDPDMQITVYYIDLQNFDKTFTCLREELDKSGIHFVRAIPFSIEESVGGRLRLLIENMDGEDSIVLHDAVVLSVGLGPTRGSERLAGLFGLGRDEFGFFSSEKENVFVSGTCKEPQGIPECMASARATALELGKIGS